MNKANIRFLAVSVLTPFCPALVSMFSKFHFSCVFFDVSQTSLPAPLSSFVSILASLYGWKLLVVYSTCELFLLNISHK